MRNLTAVTVLPAAIVAVFLALPEPVNAQNFKGQRKNRSSDRWFFENLDFSRFIRTRKKVNRNRFKARVSNVNVNGSRNVFSNRPSVGPVKNALPRRFPNEFRTINGEGNNQANPEKGAAVTPLLRQVANGYADGESLPGGVGRPGARLVSNVVCTQEESILNAARASDFLWQWGQFLDHDIDETPGADPTEAFDIEVPPGDPFFDPFNTGSEVIPLNRSGFVIDSNNIRQQINEITSVIDASNVYGSEEERARALRTLDGSGKLKTTGPANAPLLPFNEEGLPNAGGTGAELFLAGDVRANEQIALTVMHTLFVREHNYWAEQIAKKHRHLSGDVIYEKARTIVAAEMQAITYNEFLPLLLGKNGIRQYRGYKPSVDPSISNLFATAAYRVGHTMLSPELQRLKENGQPIPQGPLPLDQAFFTPDEITKGGGIDPLLRGLASQPAQKIDTQIIDAVRNFLFGPAGAGGFDLASLNIQRGREHGLPGYNDIRRHFGLSAVADFSRYHEIEPGLAARLKSLYGTPENMDAWVGLLGEGHVHGALVGETLRAVLSDQFTRLRDGDRFWYQNYLDRDFQKFIERQTLAVIIRRNTNIRNIQNDVFRLRGPGNQDCDVKRGPDDFEDRKIKKYFDRDMTSRRWKNYGFGNESNDFSAALKQVSQTVNGAFSVEVQIDKNSKQEVKKSDFEVANGFVSGVSSTGNGQFFATINSNGSGQVSVNLGGTSLTPVETTNNESPTGINDFPLVRPETHLLEIDTERPAYLTFSKEFKKPVVFVSIEKPGKNQPGLVTRIDDLVPTEATIHLAHADGDKKQKVKAKVRVLVIEAGIYTMGETGIQLEVGTAITRDLIEVMPSLKWSHQPAVFTQVQTINSDGWMGSTGVFKDGSLSIQLRGYDKPDYETIGYAIVKPGQGSFRGMNYRAGFQKVQQSGIALLPESSLIDESTAALLLTSENGAGNPAAFKTSDGKIAVDPQGGKLESESEVEYWMIGD